jgi:general secretion pathway protein K
MMPGARGSDGFALVAVMLVLAVLGVVAVEFSYAMRLEASMARTHKESLVGLHLAEAGVEQAMREIMSNATVQALDDTGTLIFYRPAATGSTGLVPLPPLPRTRVPLGAGHFTYRITDEEARINVNSSPTPRVDQLLTVLDVSKENRDVITDSLLDWRDQNDNHRAHGAESDYYLKLPVPYRARNGNLQDSDEMLQIRGVTPELWMGSGEKPGLRDLVTVYSTRNTVNINTAPPTILKALRLSDAEISEVEQSRKLTPYQTAGRFAIRGLGTGSQTFRIESEGIVNGERRARLVVVVVNAGLVAGRAPTTRTATPGTQGAPTAPTVAPKLVIKSWRMVEAR